MLCVVFVCVCVCVCVCLSVSVSEGVSVFVCGASCLCVCVRVGVSERARARARALRCVVLLAFRTECCEAEHAWGYSTCALACMNMERLVEVHASPVSRELLE